MEVYGCGLDVVMAEVVFDICKRLAALEHVDSPGVTEAVIGMYCFEPLWLLGITEMLAADAVDAASGEMFLALVDEDVVFGGVLRVRAVLFDVEFD